MTSPFPLSLSLSSLSLPLSFKDRVDEYDYKLPLEGQVKLDVKDHWRKHTLSSMPSDSEVPPF